MYLHEEVVAPHALVADAGHGSRGDGAHANVASPAAAAAAAAAATIVTHVEVFYHRQRPGQAGAHPFNRLHDMWCPPSCSATEFEISSRNDCNRLVICPRSSCSRWSRPQLLRLHPSRGVRSNVIVVPHSPLPPSRAKTFLISFARTPPGRRSRDQVWWRAYGARATLPTCRLIYSTSTCKRRRVTSICKRRRVVEQDAAQKVLRMQHLLYEIVYLQDLLRARWKCYQTTRMLHFE